jgi:hypothetical protein
MANAMTGFFKCTGSGALGFRSSHVVGLAVMCDWDM